MMPGGQTVTFATATITTGRLGAITTAGSGVDVTGCFMQPLGIAEKVTETDVGTELWRCIAPNKPAVLVAAEDIKATLIFDGDTYQITGSKPWAEVDGTVGHITIECKRQVG